MAPSTTDTKPLLDLLASTLALLDQFFSSLAPSHDNSTTTSTERIPDPPSALDVLASAAKLLKAHTTKLSLLAINKPFTPSAIATVVREISSGCVPALMSAVQLCAQEHARYGAFLSREVRRRVLRAVTELRCLLQEVQGIATQGRAGGAGNGRDSLSATGVVWECCDELVALAAGGVVGLAIKRAEEWRETLRDAITELREWREGDDMDVEGRGDGLADSDDEGVDGERDSVEDLFHAANSMPADRPELEELVQEAEGALKKITILYTAVVKRRLATFVTMEATAAQEPQVLRLDRIMAHLKRVPHQADELAMCFYDLDEQRARDVLQQCVGEAIAASEDAERNWDGEDDKYSEWFRRWKEAVSSTSRAVS